MSDMSGGPGWWLASDGKWYRPEQHPDYLPPPPPPPPPPMAPLPPPPVPIVPPKMIPPPLREAEAMSDVSQGPGWWRHPTASGIGPSSTGITSATAASTSQCTSTNCDGADRCATSRQPGSASRRSDRSKASWRHRARVTAARRA